MTPCSLAEKCQDFGRNFAFNSYPGGSKLVTVCHITGLRKGYFKFWGLKSRLHVPKIIIVMLLKVLGKKMC